MKLNFENKKDSRGGCLTILCFFNACGIGSTPKILHQRVFLDHHTEPAIVSYIISALVVQVTKYYRLRTN